MNERHQISQESRQIRQLLQQGLTVYREQSQELAKAEMIYRKSKAKAWVMNSGEGLSAERTDTVNAVTADLRYNRDLADAQVKSARLAIQVRLAELDFLRSEFSALKEDMRLAE